MKADEARLDLAKKSYDEVLDATKHQDDKIGRFLTAIAFLFTGAIAFGARSEIVGVRVDIGDALVTLPAIFLGFFLVFSIVAVLLLLVALGPNLNLPPPERGTAEYEGKPRSRIYFLSMDRMTADAWWKQHWADRPPTLENAVRNYVNDAYNLATKTTFKSGRTNEARAVFTLALLFLALSVTLAFEAAARSASAIGETASTANVISTYVLPWDGVSRGLVAIVVSTFAFALAYDGLRYAQTPDNAVVARTARRLIHPWYVAMISVPCLAASCMVPPNTPWTTIAMGLSLVLLYVLVRSLLLSVSAAESTAGPVVSRSTGYVVYVAFGVIAAGLLSLMFLRHRPGELLIGAITWVAVLELPRLSLGFRSWFVRARTLKDNKHLRFRYSNSDASGVSPPAVADTANEAPEESR
jgi:hypothetical protein